MPTYKQIAERVRANSQFVPKTCWIADVLASHGLTRRIAPNRKSKDIRQHPCPEDKRAAIEGAMRDLGIPLLALSPRAF